MSNTESKEEPRITLDFEHWMRQLLAGIKSVRRWKNKNIFSEYGFFGNKLNWIRAHLLMSFFNFFAGFFSRFARLVDPWRATPENVLEHSWKQAMIIQKLLAIENYHGNFHKLDFYKLLQYAINHDLAESIVGDIIFQEKAKNKEYFDTQERKAFFEIISNGVQEEYSIYFAFPFNLKHSDNSVEAELWNLSEYIGYCYFMLEEIVVGKLSRKEKMNFFLGIKDHHITILEKGGKKFVSVRKILRNELFPKLYRAMEFFVKQGV